MGGWMALNDKAVEGGIKDDGVGKEGGCKV